MNQTISTTTPAPPSGVTPTEVPLGISGTVSEVIAPLNFPQVKLQINTVQWGSYHNTVSINSSQAAGSVWFSWNSEQPLPTENSLLHQGVDNDELVYFVPRDLFRAFFSRQCKIDWQLRFIPVKVSDCRASTDIIYSYEGVQNVVYDNLKLANDSVHKIFDDQDDQFDIIPPLFWYTNNVHTYKYLDRGTLLKPSAFLPYTELKAFIRNPYQPNLTQPLSFDVVIIVFPIVRQALGMHAPSELYQRIGAVSGGSDPVPYFMR